ncbi:Protein of unknown function [Propionibacterium freudenreichii]|nr:hypothetical protein [Propionibacterium freudenreichii]CEG87415.1 Protein of unknown function [Propionibacterium freudenreichii]CEG96913.1 Protein of unknown function [Propionibacterium freudenreichii]CEG99395.1 Protein of unknown function [Propionibacterium freudenreichii]CEI28793.1 Protein of unknown function [Propionibacterium freudenreichii]
MVLLRLVTNFSSSGNYSPILRLMGIGGLVLIDFGIGRLIKRIRLKIWSNLISHPPRGGFLTLLLDATSNAICCLTLTLPQASDHRSNAAQ